LLSQGVQNVIVTLGAAGAFIAGGSVRCFLPGYKVEAIDTTGAGDVFNGALAAAIAEGKGLVEAASFANAAAAISVTRLGAQSSTPTRKEIEHLLATGRMRRPIRASTLPLMWKGLTGWPFAPARPQRKKISTVT
jgi:ribokinase